MILAFVAIVAGLALLVWSADKFIDSSAAVARYFGAPQLLIGMVVIGFGTSAPEMVVSAFASFQGSPGIALGNAYGSNIANIAFILGITALIKPMMVQSGVLRKELPLLACVTGLAIFQFVDYKLTFFEAVILLVSLFVLMGWMIREGMQHEDDPYSQEMEAEAATHDMSIGKAFFWLIVGLVVLMSSSRILVWGSIEVAKFFGVSDMIIGLTIIAIGTSLPELASAIIAIKKGEHDLALGNVIGSNMFNTLGVVGIAGTIHPFEVEPIALNRDMLIMGILTISLFFIGYGYKGRPGRINRIEGGILFAFYVGYMAYLASTALTAQAS